MKHVLAILENAEQNLTTRSYSKDNEGTQQRFTDKHALNQIKEAMQILSGKLPKLDNEVVSTNVTKLKPAQEPDEVLQRAVGGYQNVLILGWDKNGDLDPRADLGTSKETCLYLTQQFTHNLMNGDYTE